MLFRAVVFASAILGLADAQTIVTSSASSVAATSTESQVMPPAATQGFNIANVTSTDLFNWCHAQINTCPQICGGAASQNNCDPTTLIYTCECPNGTVPDCTAFQQTVPYFECIATYGQCINNNPNNAEAQQTCTNNEKCGTRNATAEAIAQTSAMSASTASSTQSGSQTGSATASAASSTKSSDANLNTLATSGLAAILMGAVAIVL